MIRRLRILRLLVLIVASECVCAQIRYLSSDVVDIIYCDSLRVATWAGWNLQADDCRKGQSRSSFKFQPDARCGANPPTSIDYLLSGYDRGHLCPAADRSASKARMKATFLLSNVVPQSPSLNRGDWKRYEDAARRYATNGHRLHIEVDCLWFNADTSYIGIHRLAVPHAFFKRVWDATSDSLIWSKFFYNY